MAYLVANNARIEMVTSGIQLDFGRFLDVPEVKRNVTIADSSNSKVVDVIESKWVTFNGINHATNLYGTGFPDNVTTSVVGTVIGSSDTFQAGDKWLQGNVIGNISVGADVFATWSNPNPANRSSIWKTLFSGDDTVYGGDYSDNISGYNGNDTLYGAKGNDAIDGGSGSDTVVYAGAFKDYAIKKDISGKISIVDSFSNRDGSDVLSNVEYIKFSDVIKSAGDFSSTSSVNGVYVNLNVDNIDSIVYRLYLAGIDRKPDLGGFNFWQQKVSEGLSINDMANFFVSSKEFIAKSGGADNSSFVKYIYGNVLDRIPDVDGLNYWLDQLDKGMSKGQVLTFFSDSAEFKATVIGSVPNGVDLIA